MAVIIDGSTPAAVSASAVSVQSALFTPPAGSLVVALCALGNGAGVGTSNNGAVTDTLSGSWKLLARENPAEPTAEVFCRDGTGSAMRVTYTSAQKDVLLQVLVLTGALASASQPGATAVSNAAVYSVGVTVTTSGSLVVGALGRSWDVQTLVANGITTGLGSFNGADGDTVGVFRQTLNGTPGTVTLGYSNAAAGISSLAVAEILPSMAGGTTPARVDSTSHGTVSGGAATNVVTRNVTPTQGNLLLAWVIGDSQVLPPGDWAVMLHRGGGGEAYIYYKIAGASEPISVTFTATAGTPQSTAGLIEYSGIDQNNPIAQEASTTRVAGAYTTSTAAPVATASANGLVVAFIARHGVLSAGTNTSLTNGFASVAGPGQSGNTSGSTWAWVAELFPATAGAYSTVAAWSPAVADVHELAVAFNAVAVATDPLLGDSGSASDSLLVAGPTAKILGGTGVAADGMSVARSGGGAGTISLCVPAYSDYSLGQPNQWTQHADGAPSVSVMIVNYSDGPGTSTDAPTASLIAYARAKGIQILGYVLTGWGARSATLVQNDVAAWKTLYNVTDIFFDEADNTSTQVAYYTARVAAVRTLTPGAYVMLNPGSDTIETYITTVGASSLCVFEDTYAAYTSWTPASWYTGYPASRFVHLITDCASSANMQAAVTSAIARNAGFVYVTDDAIAVNPWDSIPSYWAAEVAAVAATGGGSTAKTLGETGVAADSIAVSKSGPTAKTLGDAGAASDALKAAATNQLIDSTSAADGLNVVPSVPGIGGYLGGYLTGYVQGGIIATDGVATVTNTGLSQTSTQLAIVMPACQSGSVVVIGGGLRINGVSSGAATCAPPGTVIERAHLQRDAATPAELFVWTWVSNGTTPTYTFAFTGPAGNTGYAISLVAQGYQGVDVGTPIASLSLLAEASAVGTHTTSAVVSPATTSWGLALFADRNSSSWSPVSPLVERADTAGAVDCASVELCDTGGSVTAVSHAYASTGTATTAVAVMALGYLRQAVAGLVNVTFSDVGYTVDSGAASAVVRIGDAGVVADSQATATVIAFSDVGSGADTYGVNAAVVLGESGSSVDAVAIASPRTLGDSVSASDAFYSTAPALLSDAGGQIVPSLASGYSGGYYSGYEPRPDSNVLFNVSAANLLGDVGTVSNTLQVAGPKLLGESALASEDVDVAALASLGDSVSVAEDVDIFVLSRLGDSGSTSDTFGTAAVNLTVDAGSRVETFVVAATAGLNETGSAAAGITADALARLNDVGAAADDLNVSVMGTPVLSETVSASDVLNVVGARPTFDSASSSDDIDVTAFDLLSDSVSVFDDIDASALNLLNDIASVFDDIDVAASSLLGDSAAAVETFSVIASAMFGDSAFGSDTFSSAASSLLGDNASTLDTLQVAGPILLSDSVASFDTINVAALNQSSDSASAFDVLSVAALISLGDSASESDTLQAITLKLLGDSGTGAETANVDAAARLAASASASDTLQLAGGIRMLPRGIGVTTVLVSGGSATIMSASGMTSTAVRRDNSQSGAAPQGDRGNSSAVVQ